MNRKENKSMSLIQKIPTEAMKAASRANSLKSTGPLTEAGKIHVRLNAVKYGTWAKGFLEVFEVLGENKRHWFDLRTGILDRLQPRDVFERQLAEEIAENRWRRVRLRRAEDSMLVAQRLQFEADYARELAGEGRSLQSAGEAVKAQKEGLVALGDTGPKFAFILQCLQGVRQAVETEGFGEQGWKRLEAVYGPNPGMRGAALLASFRECEKTASGSGSPLPSDEAGNQKQAFLAQLDEEIGCFEILQEHQTSADCVVEARAHSLTILPAGDSDRILRYEKFLDQQFDRLLMRYSECHPGWQNF
jgi:hypothetical protein